MVPFCNPKSHKIGPERAAESIKKMVEELVDFGVDFLHANARHVLGLGQAWVWPAPGPGLAMVSRAAIFLDCFPVYDDFLISLTVCGRLLV